MAASRQSCAKAWVRPPMSVAHEDLSIEVLLGQLLACELQHLEVVGGGVGAGAAEAKDSGQGLSCLSQIAEQGMKAEAALVGAGGALLLGVDGEEAGVDVEDQLLGAGFDIPGLGQRLAAGGAQLCTCLRVDCLDRPVGVFSDATARTAPPGAQHAEVGT